MLFLIPLGMAALIAMWAYNTDVQAELEKPVKAAEAKVIETKGTAEQIKASQATSNSTAIDIAGIVDYAGTTITGGSDLNTGSGKARDNVTAGARSTGLLGDAKAAGQSGTDAGKTGNTTTSTNDDSNSVMSIFGATDPSMILKLLILVVGIVIVIWLVKT